MFALLHVHLSCECCMQDTEKVSITFIQEHTFLALILLDHLVLGQKNCLNSSSARLRSSETSERLPTPHFPRENFSRHKQGKGARSAC